MKDKGTYAKREKGIENKQDEEQSLYMEWLLNQSLVTCGLRADSSRTSQGQNRKEQPPLPNIQVEARAEASCITC